MGRLSPSPLNQVTHWSVGIWRRVFRSGMDAANRLSGIHRFLIHSHRSSVGTSLFRIWVSCISSSLLATMRIAANTAIRIGQVSSSGRQLDRGLICSFL